MGLIDRQRIWVVCQDCARSIYTSRPPNERYAGSIARLLFGTAAQESGLEWERQRSVGFWGTVGGFSKWQVERNSVANSLDMLVGRPLLAMNATRFLFADPHASWTWAVQRSLESVLWALRLNDADGLGVLMCRLHYLRVPAPIPNGLAEQAAYWKRHYNTEAGAGTVDEYIRNWTELCEPVIAGGI